MSLARPVDSPAESFPFKDLLEELQQLILTFLPLIDLEYFSYTSKESKKLYSQVLPHFYRPEIIRLLKAQRIYLPIPGNAFLSPSEALPGTFVLKRNVANILRRLIRNLSYQYTDQVQKSDLKEFARSWLGKTVDDIEEPHLISQITFLTHVQLSLGIELSPEDSKTPWITPDMSHEKKKELLQATRALLFPDEHLPHGWLRATTSTDQLPENVLRTAVETLCSHLTSLQLTPLADRIKQTIEIYIFGQLSFSTESNDLREQLLRNAMDERSRLLGSLTSRAWSEKEASAKTVLYNNNGLIYVYDKRTAVASYRRICRLTESEAVFFLRALFSWQDPTQPIEKRFEHARLLNVLNALDKVAQSTQGKQYVSTLFDVNSDESTNYKLAVFKQLLLGDAQTNPDFLDTTLFAGDNLVDMFNTACSLRAAFYDQTLDPVVHASVLLVLMSKFEVSSTIPEEDQQKIREKQLRRARIFLEAMVLMKTEYPFDYMELCRSLQALLNDLYKINNPEQARALIRKHHGIVYAIGSYLISDTMVSFFTRAINENKTFRFFNLLRDWWDGCDSAEERARALPAMREITTSEEKSKTFSLVIEHYIFNENAKIAPGIFLPSLLSPDSALWFLPHAFVCKLFGRHDETRNWQFLSELAGTKKERVMSRLNKLGADFSVLIDISRGDINWLIIVLFRLPDSLFNDVLSRITPVLHSKQGRDSKKKELTVALHIFAYLPGVEIYLTNPKTARFSYKKTVFDDIPGPDLVTLHSTQIGAENNLFNFLVTVVKTSSDFSDNREVRAVNLNSLAQFIITHAADAEFLAFLNKTKMADSAANLTPDELIKLDNYCRSGFKADQPKHSPRLFVAVSQGTATPAVDAMEVCTEKATI